MKLFHTKPDKERKNPANNSSKKKEGKVEKSEKDHSTKRKYEEKEQSGSNNSSKEKEGKVEKSEKEYSTKRKFEEN